ncbi:hypothetical protein CANARDRAFT_127785 [[Candida] arabinofermentans NRRL YB-2248]|uniref:Lysophospholipase n=1 Tax=[Candida] arabinofermentans NRRL YB-2248 TaxID=983967 RepID=A0A1E4T338_9ASCO|nr:hypothetical protein CANARDRAFT_127785 [[Candida] arabinofermentans NRRL YB-2248]
MQINGLFLLIFIRIVACMGINRKYPKTAMKLKQEEFKNDTFTYKRFSNSTTVQLPDSLSRHACPETQLFRKADSISTPESEYIFNRQLETHKHLLDFFKRLAIPNLDLNKTFEAYTPSIAISLSGGSFRSFLTSAGVLQAFDSRTPGSLRPGHLGGILQSSSYIAGVSGGSWLVSSLIMNDFKSIDQIKQQGCWRLDYPLLRGVPNLQINQNRGGNRKTKEGSTSKTKEKGKASSTDLKVSDIEIDPTLTITLDESNSFPDSFLKIFNKKTDETEVQMDIQTLEFYKQLHLQVSEKRKRGFKLSLTDYWGRAIANSVFPIINGSTSQETFSRIREKAVFKNHQLPFPIILSNTKNVEEKVKTKATSRLFEFNPYEFGSWEPGMDYFVLVEVLGSPLRNGKPYKGYCTSGYDDLGFITGVSSSLFNSVFHRIWEAISKTKKQTYESMKTIMNVFGVTFSHDEEHGMNHEKYVSDYAVISPNPFFNFENMTLESITNSTDLYLVDGGENENIPLEPFFHKTRQVDVVIAIDSSSDFKNYPNGTHLYGTSSRFNHKLNNMTFFHDNGEYSLFPSVPEVKKFVKMGFNKRPTFFGCNITTAFKKRGYQNSTRALTENWVPPLVVYLPNNEYTYHSNTSTFKLTYNHTEVESMLENGYSIGTYANGTIDKEFPICMGCAILKRQLDKTKTELSQLEVCRSCYNRYCYN